ncbi:MAG: histidine kinase, partial [Candidatus Wallbacteria bacterium]|nr:histidine kinase [Candidatus Wallbacteria bacterium]
RLAELYGVDATRSGQDTFASMTAAAEGRVRAAVLLGGNLYSSNPDSVWAAAALRRIPLSFSITTKLNPGHVLGRGRTTFVVPCLARDEETQSTTQESMFNLVRLSEGGSPAVPGEPRSEVDIVASLAERVLPPGRFDWSAMRSHSRLREQMALAVPGLEPIARLDSGGSEFQIAGRTFHEPRFATPDGKAHFHVTPVPASRLAPGELRLITLRSEGQFNTVVYEEEDLYRGNLRRDVVMVSEADAGARGLSEGEPVSVVTEAGKMAAAVAIADIRPGTVAMYYPEANVLVPRRVDPRSGTPAFKSVPARIERR